MSNAGLTLSVRRLFGYLSIVPHISCFILITKHVLYSLQKQRKIDIYISNKTFNSEIRAKYDSGKRRDEACCGVIVCGTIPGSPISRNLLNILQDVFLSKAKIKHTKKQWKCVRNIYTSIFLCV